MEVLKIFHNRYLSYEDLNYVSELLQSSLSLKEALLLIDNKKNKGLISTILNKLDKGEMVEEVLPCFMNKEMGDYMKCLLKNLSFKESLLLTITYQNKTKENIKALSKDVAYPIVLLFVALSALFLFDQYGLDSIVNLMKSFNSDIHSFQMIRIVLRVSITLFYILFILFLLIVLYFINPKRITLFYLLLSKYFPSSFIKTAFTQDFVSLFVVTSELGYKTKESFGILKGLHNRPLVSFLAFHMDDELLNGSSLKEASEQDYYDDTLSRFIQIASYSSDFKGLMKGYLTFAKNRIQNKMKLFTTLLQLLSYGAIGGVIVFIYQVLFLPMQAISAF